MMTLKSKIPLFAIFFECSFMIKFYILSNLLKPPGMQLRPCTFIMKLFKAEDLPQSDFFVFVYGAK